MIIILLWTRAKKNAFRASSKCGWTPFHCIDWCGILGLGVGGKLSQHNVKHIVHYAISRKQHLDHGGPVDEERSTTLAAVIYGH